LQAHLIDGFLLGHQPLDLRDGCRPRRAELVNHNGSGGTAIVSPEYPMDSPMPGSAQHIAHVPSNDVRLTVLGDEMEVKGKPAKSRMTKVSVRMVCLFFT